MLPMLRYTPQAASRHVVALSPELGTHADRTSGTIDASGVTGLRLALTLANLHGGQVTPVIQGKLAGVWSDVWQAPAQPSAAPAYVAGIDLVAVGSQVFPGLAGIAVDASGDLWVADSTNAVVLHYRPDGSLVHQFGSYGTDPGQFQAPNAIAFAANGHLFVTDLTRANVQEFLPDGTYVATFGSLGAGDGHFEAPAAIVIAANGHLFVTDGPTNRVQEFLADGTYVATFGSAGSGDGQFSNPVGITIAPDGHLWVVDSGNKRVQQFLPDGTYVSQFSTVPVGTSFSSPQYLAASADGHLWVADPRTTVVGEFLPDGSWVSWIKALDLQAPTSVAVAPNGAIWFGDAGTFLLQAWATGAAGTLLYQLESWPTAATSQQVGYPRIRQIPSRLRLVLRYAGNGTTETLDTTASLTLLA